MAGQMAVLAGVFEILLALVDLQYLAVVQWPENCHSCTVPLHSVHVIFGRVSHVEFHDV